MAICLVIRHRKKPSNMAVCLYIRHREERSDVAIPNGHNVCL